MNHSIIYTICAISLNARFTHEMHVLLMKCTFYSFYSFFTQHVWPQKNTCVHKMKGKHALLIKSNESCHTYELVTSRVMLSDIYISCILWLSITRDMTNSYVWHDSFLLIRSACLPICVTWLIPMCDMTHSYVWHDSFLLIRSACLPFILCTHVREAWEEWLSYVWEPHTCLWRCVKEWLSYVWGSHNGIAIMRGMRGMASRLDVTHMNDWYQVMAHVWEAWEEYEASHKRRIIVRRLLIIATP